MICVDVVYVVVGPRMVWAWRVLYVMHEAQSDIVIEDVTVFANPFNEPDEDEAKQIKALELQRLDVRRRLDFELLVGFFSLASRPACLLFQPLLLWCESVLGSQDLPVKETYGSTISLSDQPVFRSGIGKYIRQVCRIVCAKSRESAHVGPCHARLVHAS